MSSDENKMQTGKMIEVDNEMWELRDTGAQTYFVDMFTEVRHINGVVYLSFGESIIDAQNPPHCQVTCRLRMNLATTQSLKNALDGIIGIALKPAPAGRAN
jgi:hypothetical protein